MYRPSHILVIRLSAIGDIIMASGLTSSLCQLYPGAKIDWLIEDTNADLLRANPGINKIYLWPRRNWRSLRQEWRLRQLFGEFFRFAGDLRAERYDLILDLQGLLKSGLWAVLAGGRRRIGLGSREGSGLLMTEVLDRHIDSPLIGKEYRKLAEYLGALSDSFQLDIAVSDPDRATAAELLIKAPVVEPFVVLAPFTTRPQKHWFDERWAELTTRLRANACSAVILGGGGDREKAEIIAAMAGNDLVNFAGMTSLGQCAAIIERAALVIGVDTGLTHLGIALNIPTLALFGSTRPYLDTGRSNSRVLFEPLECSPCRRRPTCGGTFDCMRRHSVDSVFQEAMAILP